DETGNRKCRFAGMLEYDVDVALAGDVPDRFTELAGLFHPIVIFGGVDLRHLAPAFEILAVDDAFGAKAEHIVALVVVRDDSDRVRTGGCGELHAEHTKAARRAPHQNVVT